MRLPCAAGQNQLAEQTATVPTPGNLDHERRPEGDAGNASDELDAAPAARFQASGPPSMTVPVVAAAAADPRANPSALVVFRVMKCDKAETAFLADANRQSGRWTSEGTPAAYASLSASGALLEYLAHLEGDSPNDLVLVSAELPVELLEVVADLPDNWRERPYRDDVRAFGDQWIKSGRSLALQLPSVLCEAAGNALINTEHPEAACLQILTIDPITVDPRLRY